MFFGYAVIIRFFTTLRLVLSEILRSLRSLRMTGSEGMTQSTFNGMFINNAEVVELVDTPS